MKQRCIRIVVLSALTLHLLLTLAGIILLFTPLRSSAAHAYFVWDYVVSLRIENGLLSYLVIILQLLLKYWPLLLGIMRRQTLNELGFSGHLRILRIVAIGCFLLTKALDLMIAPEYELQRIAYFKELYPNAFS